jgi:hypothetical protein
MKSKTSEIKGKIDFNRLQFNQRKQLVSKDIMVNTKLY